MRTFSFIVALLLAGSASTERAAAEVGPTALRADLGAGASFVLPGALRLVTGHLDPLPVAIEDAAAPAALPGEGYLRARLSVAPALAVTQGAWRPFSHYALSADLDLFHDLLAVGDGRGPLAYDPAGRVARGGGGVRAQELHVLAAGPAVALKVGLMRSAWGLGLLAHGGERGAADLDASAFGEAVESDRVLRAQVAAFPVPAARPGAEPGLTVALAADAVVDDDTAQWSAGDRAYQVLAAVRGRTGALGAGFYAVHRWQRHAEGGETVVTVLDAHARAELVGTPALEVSLEAEAALILGSSSLAQSALHEGAFDVFAGGGVGRVAIASGAVRAVLEVGSASGDDNPFDDASRAFSFDREFRVGLLMFREALRTATAISAYNLADPTWRGVPPRGFDRVATGGAVRGASYVNPRVTWAPVAGLALYAGLLYGASDGAYVDPFRSGLAGGAPVGPNGAVAADSLGLEVDLGARYARAVGAVELSARAELGWLDPGRVFDRAAGVEVDDILGFWLHLGARW